MHHLTLGSEQASYFLALAAIAGTLIGLAFLALTFFMPDLIRRYDGLVLPVFRAGGSFKPGKYGIGPPDSLDDHELLDGDPLVVFVAYSIAVTWILFLFPLTIGLTAAFAGALFEVLAIEMIALSCILIRSFQTRNAKIQKLKPYLTVEERLWPLLTAMAMLFYAAAAVVVSLAVLSMSLTWISPIAFWRHYGWSDELTALFTMKLVCVSGLILGTYTLNKDIFIFFKTIAAERMRQRWLDSFIRKDYRTLQQTINDLNSRFVLPEEFRLLWNNGFPALQSRHAALSAPQDIQHLWKEIVKRRRATASWMLDVPCIAEWAVDVRAWLDNFPPARDVRMDVFEEPEDLDDQ